MKIVIVGCGRVGSVLADSFDRAGHEVIVIDASTQAFDRLPGSYRGTAVRGDGTDEDTLRRAGAEGADLFMAMTEATLCRTNLMASAVSDYLGLGLSFGPGLSAPTGQHPGGEHHLGETAEAGATAGGGPGASSAAADGASPNGSIPTPLASTTAREG